MGSLKLKSFVGALLTGFILTAQVHAQQPELIHVNINSSTYVDVGFKIKRLAAGNPTIAGVKQLDSSLSEILVEGYSAGSVSLLIWNEEDKEPKLFQIVVSSEDPGQAYLIERAIGLPDVHVKMLEGKILLTGSVKNQYEHNYAVQVASLYVGGADNIRTNTSAGADLNLDTQSSTSSSSDDVESSNIANSGNIIDLLQILNPMQIQLEALIIDINSEDAKDLGLQWGTDGANNQGVFTMGESVASRGDTRFRNNPIKWAGEHFSTINATINALVSKGKARILSRPNITTLMGEQATIQIGGEIPYTVINNNGYVSTAFRSYGVILQFKSSIDIDNKITAAVHAEVSNLSGQAVNGQPIIATRRADSIVNLESGSAMVIGGLMDSSEAKNVSGIPLLSKIPILGEFFKYTTKSKNKHELIIIITPRLVERDYPARMSEEMKTTYSEEFYENIKREAVDLDNPPPPPSQIKNNKKVVAEPFKDGR